MKMLVNYINFIFHRLLFLLKFVRTVFVSPSYDLPSASVISPHLITESSLTLAKYFSFSQIYVVGFQR